MRIKFVRVILEGGVLLQSMYANGNHGLRREKVLKALCDLTQMVVHKALRSENKIGFSANELADELCLERSNVSKELNVMVRDHKAIKIAGKPVLYLALQPLEEAYKVHLTANVFRSYGELKTLLGKDASQIETKETPSSAPSYAKAEAKSMGEENEGVFENIIGLHEDLALQLKQAKAAILYPPNGLHTLLTGPTGSGKTTFAGIMYKYAIEIGKLPRNAPFVIFNCADYAENSQLLISHLFGHVKGAYTGADREKKGLIDQANGGILFLDEIHRLPPEGQEMLFSMLDHSRYRRLGETESTHFASIMMIAATTENPQTAMLATFLRRIPLTIMLPGLSDRPLKVRMELICRFFREESVKIKLPLIVSKEVLKVLLLYQCRGNIGQLRNDIQLICASAFVECITGQQSEVSIKLSQLSDHLREGWFSIEGKRQEIMQSFNLNDCETITFNGMKNTSVDHLHDIFLYDTHQSNEDFYGFILEKAQALYHKGLSAEQIKTNLNAQLKNHRTGQKPRESKLQIDKEILSKIVTPQIVGIVEVQLKSEESLFGSLIDSKMIYSIALHIETLLERLQHKEMILYPNVAQIAQKYPREYQVAKNMAEKIEEELSITIPCDEVAFISSLLYAMNKEEGRPIQVLVMAHGHSTASNMVEVAKLLLGYDCLHALDMPMEAKVEVILAQAIATVKRVDRGSGVLLLVDMGSLATFSEIITKETGIPTRTIRMVSTPMVIEAARKAMLPNMTLEELEESVIQISPFIGGRVKAGIPETIAVPEQELEGITELQPGFMPKVLEMLEGVLAFLNVKKAAKVLAEALRNIAKDYVKQVDDTIYIKFLFHGACMIERMVRNEPLPYAKFQEVKNSRPDLFAVVKKHIEVVEESFGISVADSELAYIVEMLHIHFDQQSLENSNVG